MTHIIYIPGLGDHLDVFRRITLRRWNSSEVRVTFVPMHWNDRTETYEQKYGRVVEAIERAGDDEIKLVGESAGGAMALFVLSRQLGRVQSAATICGYNHGASAVHRYHRHKHPAFYKLMPVVDRVVDGLSHDVRRRITTIYSLRDHVVAPTHSRIGGTERTILKTPGHFANIVRVLLTRSALR